MLIALLDLLSPAQMFHLLADFGRDGLVVSHDNVRRWMLANGFREEQVRDGTRLQDHARRWSVAAFMERQAVK